MGAEEETAAADCAAGGEAADADAEAGTSLLNPAAAAAAAISLPSKESEGEEAGGSEIAAPALLAFCASEAREGVVTGGTLEGEAAAAAAAFTAASLAAI